MKRMLSLIVLLLTGFPLHAQDAKPLAFEGTLNVRAGNESRAVQGSLNFTDTMYLFSPSLVVSKYSPRTQFSADYVPEFELFGVHRELNSWNHSARLDVSRQFSPRFSFEIGDAFLSTTDPSRQLANSFLMLPSSRYQENAFSVRGDYSMNPRTMLSLRINSTVIRYGLAAEFREGFLDHIGNSGTVILARQLSVGNKISANYTLLHLTILDSPGQPTQAGSGILSPTQYFTVGYLNSVRPDLTVGITAGLIRTADFTYALSGQIRKRVGSIWLDAEYNRTISMFGGPAVDGPGSPQLGTGLLASNLYELVTAGATGNLGNRLGLTLRVTGSRTGAGPGKLTRRSLVALLRLNYRITERMAFYTAAELYSQNRNLMPGAPTSRHSFYIGLELSLRKRHPAFDAGSQALPVPSPTPTNAYKED